jgi:hypothetical protein
MIAAYRIIPARCRKHGLTAIALLVVQETLSAEAPEEAQPSELPPVDAAKLRQREARAIQVRFTSLSNAACRRGKAAAAQSARNPGAMRAPVCCAVAVRARCRALVPELAASLAHPGSAAQLYRASAHAF